MPSVQSKMFHCLSIVHSFVILTHPVIENRFLCIFKIDLCISVCCSIALCQKWNEIKECKRRLRPMRCFHSLIFHFFFVRATWVGCKVSSSIFICTFSGTHPDSLPIQKMRVFNENSRLCCTIGLFVCSTRIYCDAPTFTYKLNVYEMYFATKQNVKNRTQIYT